MARTVLLVEDHELNRELLTLLLETEGHRVLQAASVHDVQAQLSHTRPDVILMDVQLPDGDGLELVSRLREDPSLDGVRIFAVTAYLLGETRARAEAVGCDGLFEKPVDTDILLPAVRNG